MKHSEFEIGKEFKCGEGRWRCTDKGTRIITAILLDPCEFMGAVLDPIAAERDGWFNGPPYAIAEAVFDEDDQPGCEPCP